MGRLFGLLLLACAVWVIYEVWFKNKRFTDTEKLVWTLAAIFFSGITAIVYFITQKARK
jgi:magnesium-transporting ATPase (P-type)